MVSCIVCNTPGADATADARSGDFARWNCRRCGSFVLSGTAEGVLPHRLLQAPLRPSLMSHVIRGMQRPDGSHLKVIDSAELDDFWQEAKLPTPMQQADNLIRWIGDNQPTQFERATASPEAIAATVGLPISPKGDSQGWGWLHAQIEPKGWYRQSDQGGGKVGLSLNLPGWEKYQELLRTDSSSRVGFMAMKFDDPVLNRVLADCFKPAVEQAGFELRILTDQQPAGLIDDQLRAALISARFVIADLSHGSHGAYWEAGFAEGLALPVIYTCEAQRWTESKTHFDTNHMVTIIWNEEDLDATARRLTATIRATLRRDAKFSD